MCIFFILFNIEIYQLKSIRINTNPVLLKNYYHRDNPSFDGHNVECIRVSWCEKWISDCLMTTHVSHHFLFRFVFYVGSSFGPCSGSLYVCFGAFRRPDDKWQINGFASLAEMYTFVVVFAAFEISWTTAVTRYSK